MHFCLVTFTLFSIQLQDNITKHSAVFIKYLQNSTKTYHNYLSHGKAQAE